MKLKSKKSNVSAWRNTLSIFKCITFFALCAVTILHIYLSTVGFFLWTDVVVIKVVLVWIVTAFTNIFFTINLTFRIFVKWSALSVNKFVIFSAFCTSSIIGLSFTVQVDRLYWFFSRNTLSVAQREVLFTCCTCSITCAVLFTVLRNCSTDSISIKEVSFLTFETFSCSTFTWSWSTERVLSSRNTVTVFEFIEFSTFSTFSDSILLGAVGVRSSLNDTFTIKNDKIILTLSTFSIWISFSTIIR